MPKSKKTKQRFHDFSTDGAKNTSSHEILSQSKYWVYKKTIELDLPQVPIASSGTQFEDENIPANEIIDSGMDWGESGDVEPEIKTEDPGNIKVKAHVKAKRYVDSDAPLLTWADAHRNEYLDWNLVTEGRGCLFDSRCSRCASGDALFRRLDCFGLRMACRACLVNTHFDEPLHRVKPEEMKLFLPSSLDPSLRRPILPLSSSPEPLPNSPKPLFICPPEVISLEDRLCYAQAHEALSRLRAQLRARTVAYKKSSHAGASQSMYLKNHTLLAKLKPEDVRGISERLLRSKEKEQFQKDWERAGLSADDVNSLVGGLNVPTIAVNPTLSLGQSKDHLSWIWFTHRSVVEGSDGSTPSISNKQGADFEEIQESLRSEWCKACARARRSREEIRLVEEEMRRAIVFCHSQADWWKSRIGLRKDISPWL
ncbi:hypothetical protein PQX77_020872 [Marasmius sp. AFHP31]|nr:hypothetical protein PQX77_020872 [Marasmius sp. AFHP31]